MSRTFIRRLIRVKTTKNCIVFDEDGSQDKILKAPVYLAKDIVGGCEVVWVKISFGRGEEEG